MKRGLASLIASSLIYISGCAISRAPSQIGNYSLEKSAGAVIQNHYNGVLLPKFEQTTEYLFGLVDKNADKIINSDEAYAAITLMNPATKQFYENIMAIKLENPQEQKDKEVVKK